MRILYCPLRSPFSASNRFPGNAERSFTEVAASIRSIFIRAECSKPGKLLDPFACGKVTRTLVAATLDHRTRVSSCTLYVKSKVCVSLSCLRARVPRLHWSPCRKHLISTPASAAEVNPHQPTTSIPRTQYADQRRTNHAPHQASRRSLRPAHPHRPRLYRFSANRAAQARTAPLPSLRPAALLRSRNRQAGRFQIRRPDGHAPAWRYSQPAQHPPLHHGRLRRHLPGPGRRRPRLAQQGPLQHQRQVPRRPRSRIPEDDLRRPPRPGPRHAAVSPRRPLPSQGPLRNPRPAGL